MPTYDYQCGACGHRFEAFQKMSDDPITKCPECGEEQVKRLISATAFHLKGGGWYKTDYASNGSAGTKNGTAKSTDAESKSSDSTESAKPSTETPKSDSSD